MATPTDLVYNAARVLFANGALDWPGQTINIGLVSGLYVPQTTDEFVSSIPPGAFIVRDIAVSNLGVSAGGACFGTIAEIEALLSTLEVVGLVMYVQTGDDTTSNLVYYTSTGPGFPFLPVGFNYVIGYDQTNGGFFQV